MLARNHKHLTGNVTSVFRDPALFHSIICCLGWKFNLDMDRKLLPEGSNRLLNPRPFTDIWVSRKRKSNKNKTVAIEKIGISFQLPQNACDLNSFISLLMTKRKCFDLAMI